MDKRERQIVKTLREQKPISEKEYLEQKKAKAAHDKWISDLKRNYPGICTDDYGNIHITYNTRRS